MYLIINLRHLEKCLDVNQKTWPQEAKEYGIGMHCPPGPVVMPLQPTLEVPWKADFRSYASKDQQTQRLLLASGHHRGSTHKPAGALENQPSQSHDDHGSEALRSLSVEQIYSED